MRPIPIIVLLLVNVDAEWVLASGTGQDCDTVCSGLGRTCDEQALVDLQTTELCSDTAVQATFASAMSKASISGQCSSLLRIKSRLGSIADLHLANLACFIDEWPASCTLSAVYNALCCCESTPGTCGQELVANGCTLPSTTTTVTSTTTGTSTMTSVTTTRSTTTTVTTTTVTTTTVTTTTITTITSTTISITTTTITTTATISSSTTISTTATKTSSSTLTSSSSTVSVTSTTTSSATISSSTTISTTVTQTTSTSSSVTSSSTSSTTNTVTTTTSSTLTSSSTTVTQTTSTSSSVTRSSTSSTTNTVTTTTSSTLTSSSTTVTQTTSTSSSVTQTTSTSSSVTSSSTSSTTNTVTTTSMTSSSTTLTSVTQSSTTTSTTLLLKLQLPPDVEAENPEGTVITALLQGALAVLEANQESIVLETDTGEVTVVKLNTPTTSDAFVFEFPAVGEDNESSAAAIAVSVPVSLVQQLQLEGNVMLSVTQLNEESMATLADTSGSTVILLAPIIDFSLVQEKAGAVKTATVSGLVDPIIFRIADDSPTEEDLCVFFDFDTNSWSTEGVALATSAQVEALPGVNSSGTWCAATHLSLFSSAQITPLENRIEQEQTIDWNSYMIAVILMVVLCIPTCAMFCTWSFFLARPAASGKTKIQDARGRSHVVTFTRNKIMADRMPSEKSPKNAEQKKKVLVTWDVEPDQIMSSIKHMQGHGWVAMDSRVVQTKSMTSMRSMTREKSNVSEELRKASQQRVPQARGLEEDGVSFSDIVEESLVEASLSWMGKASSYEVFEDREPVYYWSTTHQMLMQAFISGSGMFDDDEPTYNVMVGPHRQLRQQVPCQYLFAALRDGDTVFYDEGDGKTRIWRKGIVVESIHARGTIRLFDVSEQEGTLASDQLPREASAGDLDPSDESTTGAKSGEAAHKTVSISRICRRFEKGQIVCVFQGQETGWQSAVVGHVEDFTDEFSPLHLKSLQVHLASATDPVDIQTCFIRFAKAGDGIGISV